MIVKQTLSFKKITHIWTIENAVYLYNAVELYE